MRRKHVIRMAIALSALGLLWPVKVSCRAPLYSCATAPDSNGIYRTMYVYEPFIVYWLERQTFSDIGIEFGGGTVEHRVNR